MEHNILKEIDDCISSIKKKYEESIELAPPMFDCNSPDAWNDSHWDINPFTGKHINETITYPHVVPKSVEISFENASFQKNFRSELFSEALPKYKEVTDSELTALEASIDNSENFA